ncbi:c-type cytochrome [Hydrogenophaga sp. RAC07]|uniref:c-type cytochrome n=1 Tax=Hydrogenophaga sp. RAC07 TaxID=1842537 RepID=UPI00083DD1E6
MPLSVFFRRTALLMALLLPAWAALAAGPAPNSAAHTVPDTMAQRLLACTVCHGEQGRATNAGYFPRIAGKPAGYLYNQLVHFRAGRRNNEGMTSLLDSLSDTYLREIAAHFASLDLPYPAPQRSDATPAVLQRGEALALRGDPARDLPACVACHGQALTGVNPAIPGLLGLPRDYLIGQLGAWQTGLRRASAPDCMGHVAQRLSGGDVSAVASWLASQPLPANTHPAPGTAQPLPLRCGSEG